MMEIATLANCVIMEIIAPCIISINLCVTIMLMTIWVRQMHALAVFAPRMRRSLAALRHEIEVAQNPVKAMEVLERAAPYMKDVMVDCWPPPDWEWMLRNEKHPIVLLFVALSLPAIVITLPFFIPQMWHRENFWKGRNTLRYLADDAMDAHAKREAALEPDNPAVREQLLRLARASAQNN